MRIYYRGPDALVTDSQFIWAANAANPFAIAELRKIEIVQRRLSARATNAALVTAGVAALLLAPGWIVLDNLFAHIGLVAAALVAVVLTASRTRTVRRWELRADYRRREVILYSTGNPTTFNQVSRALRRSVESADPIRTPRRMVAA